MNRRGMTVIELLLALAIVSVIAAVIFAAFGPARERGRQAVCASNLHQIGLAFAQYVSDYDGADPVLGVRMKHAQLGLPGGGQQSTSFFHNYIKNYQVEVCPSYHDIRPIIGEGSTYKWPGLITESDIPEFDWSTVVARRGSNFVLCACDQHNSALNFRYQPVWATKRVIVLRISQQVQSLVVPAGSISAFNW